ncbi:MAG: hypothetical protein Q7U04_05570 [Bacteriovorax sp.]|nr:hypothetical protein [Bacteriovorax sp.]
MPRERQIASDGTEYKILPNENKVVKRPAEDRCLVGECESEKELKKYE